MNSCIENMELADILDLYVIKYKLPPFMFDIGFKLLNSPGSFSHFLFYGASDASN